ncbi:ABC transporter substrate-binding protein [Rhabdochromatium marinum]|uniref:ABC transporter substrate-binding protein n=1 Tax=Rhabdochromatium marinum TaxID=48729 RepID=UPI0019061821|nr:ABC transporter substrate-binding protein [Rhabdochromatium marinum]MBK1647691.1 twin-arginine translocation pathway signal protein [Rhabdochromatium marinum]
MKRRDFLTSSAIALASRAGLTLAPGLTSPALAGVHKVKLKIGYLPITDHLLIIAAARESFAHVEIQPLKFSSWPDIAEALKAGAIDGGFLLTPIGLTLRVTGVPIQAVMLGHRNGSVITVKHDSGIHRIEDLRGRSIAVPSPFSTHNILLRKVLAEHQMEVSEVRIIDMAPPEMVHAMATNQIDCYIVAEPFGAQAEALEVGRVLMLSKDIWHDHICCVLNMHEDIINQYPQAVHELVNAMGRTARFVQADPAAAAKGSVKLIGQRPEIIETVLTTPKGRITFNDLVPRRQDFEATQGYMQQFGIAQGTADLDAYLNDRFVRAELS